MELPEHENDKIHFRRKIWGQTENIAFYNSSKNEWRYKMSVDTISSVKLSNENLNSSDWIKVASIEDINNLKIDIKYGNVYKINKKLNELTSPNSYKKVESITTAKKGDTVEFISGPVGYKGDNSFRIGSEYICSSDYREGGYHSSETIEGKKIAGTISVVEDSKGKKNGWAAAFFRIKRRANEITPI